MAHYTAQGRKLQPLVEKSFVCAKTSQTPDNINRKIFVYEVAVLRSVGLTYADCRWIRLHAMDGPSRSQTTPHSCETQAQDSAAVSIQAPLTQGRRPGKRGNGTEFCAPDARNTFPIELSSGPGPQALSFLGTFVSLQKYLARGRNFPNPPSRL